MNEKEFASNFGELVAGQTRDLSLDEWRAVLVNDAASRGQQLVDAPRLHEPVEFISYIIRLSEQWRSREEAADLLRIAAALVGASQEGKESIADLQLKGSAQIDDSTPALEPDVKQWVADAQWALKMWQDGMFEGRSEEYVAVYRTKVRGFGSDPIRLRREVAHRLQVPLQRIVLKYIVSDE